MTTTSDGPDKQVTNVASNGRRKIAEGIGRCTDETHVAACRNREAVQAVEGVKSESPATFGDEGFGFGHAEEEGAGFAIDLLDPGGVELVALVQGAHVAGQGVRVLDSS